VKLIVNADDFGMSKGVNLGILECFKEGVVTSTSLMANMGAFDHAIEIMKNNDLDVGIHFNLTIGEPLSPKEKIKTLLNETNNLEHNIKRLAVADKNEIRLELMAQLNKFLSTGFSPSHIDFHHELNFSENVLEVTIEIAKEYNLPMRAFEEQSIKKMNEKAVKHSRRFLYEFFGNDLTVDSFINELNKAKHEKIAEIMTHPAYVDNYLLTKSGYSLQRAKELQILTTKEVKEFIKDEKIELIGFKELGEI